MSNRRLLPGRFRFSFPADSLTVHNTLKDNIMRYLELKIPPPVVALVCVAAMWAVAKVTPAFGVAPEVRWAFVGMFVIAGLFFDFRGLLAFLRARTSINPMTPQRASSLVTTGVYRYTRNPMYVGLACLVVAVAIFLDAPAGWLGVGIFVLYITRFQIQPEEAVLLENFGDSYRTYCDQVRRWL